MVFDHMLLNWWFGDALGILIVAPIVVNWSQRKFSTWNFLKIGELAGFIVVLSLVSYLIFFTKYNLIYLFIPVLLWPIFRFGKLETSLVVLAISGLAIWSIAHQKISNTLHQNDSILVIQSFIGVVAITFLVLSAVLNERKKMQASLQESLIKYRTLLENLPQKIFVKNTELFFVSCNENFAKELNISSSEIAGKTDYDFFPKEMAEKYRREDAEFLASGKPLETEICELRDGQTVWTQVVKIPVKDDNGAVTGVQGIFWDITERKRAEIALQNSKDFAENLIQTANVMVIGLNAKGEITIMNNAAEYITGYSFNDLKGKNWFEILVPKAKYPNIWAEFGGLTKNGRMPRVFENPILTRSGDERFISWQNGVLHEGDKVSGTISFGIDITDRKQAELELEKYRKHLENMVEERTAELEIAKERAESADQLKSAFLATMSHELRTPLNSIIGFTGMLLQELPGPLNDEQKKQLRMTQKSGRHLLSLINDILDLSKIEAGQLKLSTDRFKIADVIQNVIDISRPFAQSKNLALTSAVDPELTEVVSDQMRVQQIIINLVNNALKFTEIGFVTVNVSKKGNRFVIKVIDTGIGIEATQVRTLFKPFIQIDSGVARKHEGTGLGLSISKKLATMLGGTISVESEPEKGSTFTVELPIEMTHQV
jgi:PAS domain S-box-containing protein